MTESVAESSTAAKSGVDAHKFASRRVLVWRRFLRNKAAVASLVLLVLLFIGCYAEVIVASLACLRWKASSCPRSTSHSPSA
ncbi:hypothetical protein [Mycolicibacterium pulveris]